MDWSLVTVKDNFWKPRMEQMCKDIIPYQYEVLNDRVEGIPKSHAVENFKIAAGMTGGTYEGMLFQDSDVGKWMEAASCALIYDKKNKDRISCIRLEKQLDELVDIMEEAQQPDGYLNSCYICKMPGERFTNIAHGHELYCAGHLLEAAVCYAEVSGKEKFLNMMERYVALLMKEIGPEKGQKRIYPGHPEIELALYRLYRYTGKTCYLDFMEYLIRERGKQPSFLEKDPGYGEQYKDSWFDLRYHQAHMPATEQTEAVGHAVRAVYLYAAMADLAYEKKDRRMAGQIEKLWEDVTERKMYITGAIGAEEHGESFGAAYDLPNERAYAETCASIGLIFWAKRMLRLFGDSRYADVMELALYNGAISGMAQDGRHYFYVNPLELQPQLADARYDMRHVKKERVPWLGCACCPPNLARLTASLPEYISERQDKERCLFIHLYIAGIIGMEENGTDRFQITGNYLSEGRMTVSYHGEEREWTVKFRIPGWSMEKYSIRLNGEELVPVLTKGYAEIRKNWKEGDFVEMIFDERPRLVYANPRVRADAGRAALMRGPVVYCLEEKDNGGNLNAVILDGLRKLREQKVTGLQGEETAITFQGYRETMDGWENCLYSWQKKNRKETELTAVPYHLWGNRGVGEMLVWIRTE